MTAGLPPELAALLDGTDPRARERAWSAFLGRYSDLLLRAARSFGGDYDAAMDRYEYVLEGLRQDDFRRLRSYAALGRSRFESWLVVVARRLCHDFVRGRYGRAREGEDPETREERAVRRRLADLAAAELRAELVHAPGTTDPEAALRRAELSAALEAAVRQLPPRDRLLLRLRFEDQLPVREVADVLGLPSVFHVYRRLRKVLDQLRERLAERGVDDGLP